MDNMTVVVVKGIILHDQKVLMIKRAEDDAIHPGIWEFAGGKIEFGEALEDALMREIREEVDLTVTVDKLLYAATFMTHEHRQVVVLAYACAALDAGVMLSFEHQDYLWADEAQMRRLIGRSIREDMDRYAVWKHIFPE